MKNVHGVLSVILLVALAATSVALGVGVSASPAAQTVAWTASQPIDLSSGAAQYAPAVAADSAGNVYVVWEDYRNGHADIYFSQQIAGTSTWSTPVKLNDDGSANNQTRPTIAVGDGYIYVAWQDYRNAEADIYSTRRLLAGGAWEANKRVNQDRINGDTPDIDDQKRPSLCMDANGNAYAVWQDRRNGAQKTYYGSRAPSDADWSYSEKVTLGEGTYPDALHEQVSPNIACVGTGSSLLRYVVWQDQRADNANIFYGQRSNDVEWYPEVGGKIVDDTLHKDQTVPAIAFDNASKAWAVWLDVRTGTAQIWGASYPRGGTWSANFQISSAGAKNAGETRPSVVVAPSTGLPYVVWIDAWGNVAYSSWNGSSWAAQAAVSNSNTGTHLWPDIAASPNALYAVWQDGRSGTPHIYFTRTGPAQNDSSLKIWPGGVRDKGRFYLDLTVNNSEPYTRSITTTVQLPNDFYFYRPDRGASTSAQSSGVIEVSAHQLTWTQQLHGFAYDALPSWSIYVSTALTLPTVLNSTAVITDNVAGSSNSEILLAPIIVNPLQRYLPLVFKR